MIDQFDPILRARLERLARAVPVRSEIAVNPVVTVRSRLRISAGLGALSTAALILVLVLAMASLGGGSDRGEAVASTSDGMFRLTIRTPVDHYGLQQPIEVVATLEYIGEDPSIEVWSHPGVPGFGVEEVDGTRRVDPGYRLSCVAYPFLRGQPIAYPFAKSGGWESDGPDAQFMIDYFNETGGRPDPVLRLPAGRWRIFAVADFSEDECGGSAHELEAVITVVVDAQQPTAATSTASPSPATPTPVATTPSASPTVMPITTLPPPDLALPYPDGCAAYGLSKRRCAYIVGWARQQAGIGADEPVTIQLLGDPDCPSTDVAPCHVARTTVFIVRVRLITPIGDSSDHPVFCGLHGDASLLCTEQPRIYLRSPMDAYHDIPCAGEAPDFPCATPIPSIEPAAAAAAVPLDVASIDIPIDHAGSYSVPVGQAVLPNGILSEATFALTDVAPSDVLVSTAMFLAVTSLDGGPPFDNLYNRGWHKGTERVQVTLTFTVEWFEPGAVLHVTGVRVR